MEEMDERGRGGGRNGLQPVRPQGPQSKVSGGDGILATCSVARLDKPGNHLRKTTFWPGLRKQSAGCRTVTFA